MPNVFQVDVLCAQSNSKSADGRRERRVKLRDWPFLLGENLHRKAATCSLILLAGGGEFIS